MDNSYGSSEGSKDLDDEETFNGGYRQLGSLEGEEEDSPSEVIIEESVEQSDPLVERLVSRAMKRLEDDHAATNRATWTQVGDDRIDRWLTRMETRISKLEDAVEEVMDGEAKQTDPECAAPISGLQEKLRIDDIKASAMSIQLEGLPEFLRSDDIPISELIARLKIRDRRLH